MKEKVKNKELSWLSFNGRLLQEASDPSVPLVERFKFLGIFSSNLDEFFRVRVAILRRLKKLGKRAVKVVGGDPKEILQTIYETVLTQQAEFDKIYQELLKLLAAKNIFILDEHSLDDAQQAYVRNFFRQKIRPLLIPLMIDQMDNFPDLKDHSIYLAIRMSKSSDATRYKYALIEVPTNLTSRFVILPESNGKKFIMLLDDVIRFSLKKIFSIFQFDQFEAYTIKLTRDAELDLDDDISESFLRKMSKGLAQRKKGNPVRFIYDQAIPEDFLKYLTTRLREQKNLEDNLIPGGRYHNFKDFIQFPNLGSPALVYKAAPPLPHPLLAGSASIFEKIREQDILLHYPYQTFNYIIDFLREAAIDPHVVSIKVTLYRVARNSNVINALINASRNGKHVTVMMELQARFDEEANIHWSRRLQEEGVQVIHSSPGFKVHSKLILVKRKVKKKVTLFANIGTGNLHESTARLYSDHALLTADPRLTNEVRKVFESLANNFNRYVYRHLLVSPFNMRQKLNKLIDTEIKNVGKGNPAYIYVKLNNLTDSKIIRKLYEASQAGVEIRLMVRGMFSLIPGIKGMSENIRATGTIDRFLEHTRVFVFCHGGNEKYYLSSADWMPRNLDRRIEVAAPVYDKTLQKEIKDFLNIHWRDNVKTRLLNKKLDNQYYRNGKDIQVRAQTLLYRYFQEKLKPAPEAAPEKAPEENTVTTA